MGDQCNSEAGFYHLIAERSALLAHFFLGTVQTAGSYSESLKWFEARYLSQHCVLHCQLGT